VLALAAARAHGAADPATLSSDLGVNPTRPVTESSLFEDVVVAPIPISNPTIGTGLAVVVMPFYRLGADSPLSNTIVAAGYTSSGSWAVGAAQSTRLRGDTMRLDGYLGYADIRYRFYGVGASAGNAGISVPLEQRAAAFVPELLYQLARGAFVGVRYRAIQVDTGVDAGTLPPELGSFSSSFVTVTSSGIGPVATLDTRNNDMAPSAGFLVELRTNFANRAIASEVDYRTASLAVNYYRKTGPGVLALRGYACGASQHTPLFDLCLYGAGSDLRGYEIGRYRDRSMIATQAEYRFPLRGRFGGVVFAGTGWVAPSFGQMSDQPSLPSFGAGVRWLASEKARVNLSLDVARGRDGSSFYMYVKEAF